MSGRIILVCGGYRSGSTLQYNLLGEYVERANVGRRIGFVEPAQVPLLPQLWSFVDALGVAVAKCHLGPDQGGGSEHWRGLVGHGRVLPLYTVRDWRDVVHSWARLFDQDLTEVFDHPRWALNLANLESWLAVGARVERYERLVADPSRALRGTTDWAGLPLDEAAVDEAAGAVAAAAAAQVGQHPDARTLLHRRHVNDPGGGAWRAWRPEERALVDAHVAPLMQRFGYAWD